MKKYYGHTLLYLHETISLGSGRSDRFTEVFADTYQPMMDELGARLFAIWESTPYNGHWPQVTVIWEIDGFADYARIGRPQARGGSHEAAAGKWSAFLADIGASGEGRIMYPGPATRRSPATRGQFRCDAGDSRDHADQAGTSRRLHPRAGRLYVPWSERTGKRWLGSFTTTFASTRSSTTGLWTAAGSASQPLSSWKEQPAGRDRHLDERGAGVARRLGGLDPAGPTASPLQ